MAEDRREPQPMMNGAAKRLGGMRRRLEHIETELQRGAAGLAVAQQVIEQIGEIRAELRELAHEFRDAETLAGRENWRLLAIFDEPFATEYVSRVDLQILKMGLQSCPVDRLEALWEFVSDELARKGKART